MLIVAIVMTMVGLGFKVAAAPFHFWAPDVYQGAPTPSAALIASGSKVAGFFILFQVVVVGFAGAEGSAVWRGYISDGFRSLPSSLCFLWCWETLWPSRRPVCGGFSLTRPLHTRLFIAGRLVTHRSKFQRVAVLRDNLCADRPRSIRCCGVGRGRDRRRQRCLTLRD